MKKVLKQKDFSHIERILLTNGVGFIRCFFRSNLEPLEIISNPRKLWRIDLSDGVNYLGSFETNTDIVGLGETENDPAKFDCCIGEKENGLGKKIGMELVFTSWPYQGECLFSLDTDTIIRSR